MKSFSELTSASFVSNSDILAISQENSGTYSSKKTTVKEVSDFANQNFAEEYDSTSSYAVGNYVIYESVLYKCIGTTTGTFDSTKWTSVVVTNEMGSGGGGGTGGHTIIDENGNSMTARAGLQFVGGANVSDSPTNNRTIVDLASAGGIDGVFIDTSNVIVPRTSYATNFTYTATEDCVAIVDYANNPNGSAGISVDDKPYSSIYSSSLIQNTATVFLKKGQTLKGTNTFSGADVSYIVYGIQTGTTHSKFQPVIYSTEEREIGVWKDGKPLYQKTLVVASVGSVGVSLVTPIQINDIPFDYIEVVEANIYDSTDDRRYILPNLSKTVNDRIFLHPYLDKNASPVVFYASLYTGGATYSNMIDFNVIIQYTKTTDIAGSGSWTPQGVPTHHYSTDEQVIGTYLGETLYEKTWINLNVTMVISGGNWQEISDVDLTGVDTIVDSKVWRQGGTGLVKTNNVAEAGVSLNQKLQFSYFSSNFGETIKVITLQYTKSS